MMDILQSVPYHDTAMLQKPTATGIFVDVLITALATEIIYNLLKDEINLQKYYTKTYRS